MPPPFRPRLDPDAVKYRRRLRPETFERCPAVPPHCAWGLVGLFALVWLAFLLFMMQLNTTPGPASRRRPRHGDVAPPSPTPCILCHPNADTPPPVHKVVVAAALHCSDIAGRSRVRDSWARDVTSAGLIFHFFVAQAPELCSNAALTAEADTHGDMVVLGDAVEGAGAAAAGGRLLAMLSHVARHPDVDALVRVDAAATFVDARQLAARLRATAEAIGDPRGVFAARLPPPANPAAPSGGSGVGLDAAWLLSRPAVRALAEAAAAGALDATAGGGDSAAAVSAWLGSAPSSPSFPLLAGVQLVDEPGVAPCPEAACADPSGQPPWAVRLAAAANGEDDQPPGPALVQPPPAVAAGLRRQREPEGGAGAGPPLLALWEELSARVHAGLPLLPRDSRCCTGGADAPTATAVAEAVEGVQAPFSAPDAPAAE